MKTLHIVALGAGTANYWFLNTLCRSAVRGRVAGLTLVDRDRVSAANAWTCPEFADAADRPKPEALARLVRRWCDIPVPTDPRHQDAEDMDWDSLPFQSQADLLCAVIGLDDWAARVRVVQDLRTWADRGPALDAVALMLAVDRGQAQMSVFGPAYADPCPACALPAELPRSEPCVVLDSHGNLLRGNLRAEARTLAGLAVDTVASYANRAARGPNTKTNLVVEPGSGRVTQRLTRALWRRPLCRGAHEPTCDWCGAVFDRWPRSAMIPQGVLQ